MYSTGLSPQGQGLPATNSAASELWHQYKKEDVQLLVVGVVFLPHLPKVPEKQILQWRWSPVKRQRRPPSFHEVHNQHGRSTAEDKLALTSSGLQVSPRLENCWCRKKHRCLPGASLISYHFSLADCLCTNPIQANIHLMPTSSATSTNLHLKNECF